MLNLKETYYQAYYRNSALYFSPDYYNALALAEDATAVEVDYGDHKEFLNITLDDCDIPDGRISIDVLAPNIYFWKYERGYKLKFFFDMEVE